MDWTAINGPHFSAGSAPVEADLPISTRLDKPLASKFRVNVLAASQSIVSTRPKRAKSSKRDDPPICNIGKRLRQSSSDEKTKESNQNNISSNLLIEVQSQCERVSKRPKLEESHPTTSVSDSRVDNRVQNCQSSTHREPSELKQTGVDDLLDFCDFSEDESESNIHWPQTPRDKLGSRFNSDSDVKDKEDTISDTKPPVLDSLVGSSLMRPIVVDSSNSDCDSFENFDDSVFDQLRLDSAPSKPKGSKTRPLSACGFATNAPAQPVNKAAQHGSTPAFPNGAPFAPFMHPNLGAEDWLPNLAGDGKALVFFRVAEAIRLISAFRSGQWKAGNELRLALFATLNDMKYANSLGHGQGLVFSDIFFAHQPPYLTASCKIPYNVEYLIAKTKDKPKPLLQTFLSISKAKRSKHDGRTPTASPSSSSSPAKRSEPSHQKLVEVEVLDIRLSS